MRTDPAPVLAVTAAQRTAVEAALRRRDLAPRRARAAGDGQGRGAGPGRGDDRALERADPGDGAPLAGRVPGGRDRGAGRCAPPGTPPEGRCRLSGRAGAGGRDAPAHAGLAVRCLDLASAQRLSRAADRGAHRPGLAAGAAAPAALRLRPAQTHPRPSARPGRSRRLRGGPAGGGGKRCGRSRSATNCTTRTRPTWTPTRT